MSSGRRLVPIALSIVLLAPGMAWGQREHFQLKFGPSYDEGDFGASQTTRAFFFPVTFRYLGDAFDIGITGSYVRLDAPADVVIVEGTPQETGRRDRDRQEASGLGDTILRGRYYLVDDPGPGSWIPALAPFVKLKLPTADDDENLGTGETDVGLGLEFDKTFPGFFIFGDLSYTFMGDPPGLDFRDRPAVFLGAGRRVTEVLTLSAFVDWRRALVAGNDDPLELGGVATVRISPVLSVSPYAFVGLTDGSPDWGIGTEVSWRFGRW